MTKYVHGDVLDGGLNVIKNSAIKMLLVKAYTLLDNYTTVQSNKIAEVSMSSTDYTITGLDGQDHVLTTASGKTAVASGNSGGPNPPLHFVFIDGVSKVLWVVTETSQQTITAGNTVTFPSLTVTIKQPT